MKTLAKVSWALVIVGGIFAVLLLVSGVSSATGAPQEAVVICLALALVIIPYCWARAWAELAKPEPNEYNYKNLG